MLSQFGILPVEKKNISDPLICLLPKVSSGCLAMSNIESKNEFLGLTIVSSFCCCCRLFCSRSYDVIVKGEMSSDHDTLFLIMLFLRMPRLSFLIKLVVVVAVSVPIFVIVAVAIEIVFLSLVGYRFLDCLNWNRFFSNFSVFFCLEYSPSFILIHFLTLTQMMHADLVCVILHIVVSRYRRQRFSSYFYFWKSILLSLSVFPLLPFLWALTSSYLSMYYTIIILINILTSDRIEYS